MKVLAEEPWAWMLLGDETGALYMTVMSGSVGLYSVDFQLTEHEAENFATAGRSALEALARDVTYQSSKYGERHISNFTDLPGINDAILSWRAQGAEP
jgi:hypothetical protein